MHKTLLMKNIIPLMTAALMTALLFSSCGNGTVQENKDRQTITEKIEYPVFIRSPYDLENGDWWVENIETSDRMKFVETLFDWAYSGKVKCFDYLTYLPLSQDEVKAIENEVDTLTIINSEPPYEERDTVIQKTLDLRLIHRVKFLEEWEFDMAAHTVHKKILGIAPALTVYGDSLEVRGYTPLFWILFDEQYIKEVQKVKS